ncbi:MAG: ankyrin repeat domain-containing protein [Holosporales bacterium]|jgi:hypothetical protein|nr:ankyrin repeat domain-containing protein [Holosporales bacterium]
MNIELFPKCIGFLLLSSLANASYFGINKKEYCSERVNFQRGYIAQVLSEPFGTPSGELPIPHKLSMISLYLKSSEKTISDEINAFDRFGMAPIHYLSSTIVQCDYEDFFKLAQLLIKHGADVNLKNKFGITPFVLAANSGNFDAARAFVQSGKLAKDTSTLIDMFASEKFDVMTSDLRYQIIYGRTTILGRLLPKWNPELKSPCLDQKLLELEEVIASTMETNTEEEIDIQIKELIGGIRKCLLQQKTVEVELEESRVRAWEDIRLLACSNASIAPEDFEKEFPNFKLLYE